MSENRKRVYRVLDRFGKFVEDFDYYSVARIRANKIRGDIENCIWYGGRLIVRTRQTWNGPNCFRYVEVERNKR